jgi:hypothetical protein
LPFSDVGLPGDFPFAGCGKFAQRAAISAAAGFVDGRSCERDAIVAEIMNQVRDRQCGQNAGIS